jgi:hypothetical protein
MSHFGGELRRLTTGDPIMATGPKEVIGIECAATAQGKPIYIVGTYDRPTGGCDAVKTQDYITQRVQRYHDAGYHVLFEGILASITFQRWADMADYVGKENMVFAFLSTSREQSFANIAERRKSSKVVRGPFKEDLFDKKVQMLRRCRERYLDGGYRVLDCTFGEASRLLVETLERG